LRDSTFTDRDVIRLSLDFTFVELNSKIDSALVSKYGVSAYPTVILFKSSGEEVDRIVGYLPPREFLKTVKSYLRGEGTLADLERKLEANPSDVRLLYQVGEKYGDRSKYEEALKHYRNLISVDPQNRRGKTDSALFKIAVVYRRQKEDLAAIDGFKDLIRRFPETELRFDAEEYIPYIHARMGDSTTALRLYEKLLVDYPDLEKKEKEWIEKQIKKLKE
jgi:tetratricopeptide (TPR) repeat protein